MDTQPLSKLCSALVKAQAAMHPVMRDAKNPHFKSAYATLDATLKAILPPLHANGLCLIQRTEESDDGVTVESLFVHESGETMSAGKLHFPAAKQDPQGYASALTYARRNSALAAAGLAPTDDDGEAAMKVARNPLEQATGNLNQHQLIAIKNAAVEAGINLERITARFKVEALGEIPATKYASIMAQLTKARVEKVAA